jgi:hypothetical protein
MITGVGGRMLTAGLGVALGSDRSAGVGATVAEAHAHKRRLANSSRGGMAVIILEIGNWRLEGGSWRLEVGGWKLEVGGWDFGFSFLPFP